MLEQSAADLKSINPEDFGDANILFCCRVRGMRPQGAYYGYIDRKFWPLFDACGPERETGFGNPQTPEQAAAKREGKA